MATLSQIRSSTLDAVARTEQQSFSLSLAEALQRTEEPIHANMDKARSAFERMKNKAAEAQSAKDREIAELQKALDLAKAQLKAQEISFQEKEVAYQQKIQAGLEREASLQQQLASSKEVEKTVKGSIQELANTTFGPNPQEHMWFKTSRFAPRCKDTYPNGGYLSGWPLMHRLANFFDQVRKVEFI